MSNKHNNCLILNADYSPLCIISWQKAIVLWYRNDISQNIEILSYHNNDHIKSCSGSVKIPSIIKLVKYLNIFNRKIKFSRRNLFIRDNYTCQYCGVQKELKYLTYDHVIPKSVWSDTKQKATNWNNITTACVTCNLKKGNKTPNQANMPLMKDPYVPIKNEKYLPIVQHLSTIEHIPQDWIHYLPSNYLCQHTHSYAQNAITK